MSWPAVKKAFTQDDFADYVKSVPASKWHPGQIMWHNTAAPSLAQWMKSAAQDKAAGFIPGITRIRNLEAFFRDNNGWSGCPHLFIANDLIWVMNPLTAPGVHSPNFNSTALAIEMCGDFAVEDDDSGEGLRVKNNTIFATTVLCEAFGIPAVRGSIDHKTLHKTPGIYLHKDDPGTTHDCPGKDVAQDVMQMISSVQDLMSGGEHSSEQTAHVIAGNLIPTVTPEIKGTTLVSDLAFRSGPGVTNQQTGSLSKGTTLMVMDQAKNGTSSWLRVKTPAGYVGWVAGKYVELNNGAK